MLTRLKLTHQMHPRGSWKKSAYIGVGRLVSGFLPQNGSGDMEFLFHGVATDLAPLTTVGNLVSSNAHPEIYRERF